MKNLALLSFFVALFSLQCKVDPVDCICIEIYAPVCGEDGVQYDNSCFADCAGVSYEEGFCSEEADGIINYYDPEADGCGWVITIAFDDLIFDFRPNEDLAEEFKIEGQDVRLAFKQTVNSETCGLGTIRLIEILEIEKI